MGVLGQHKRWVDYHKHLTESTATIVGAKPKEVVVMNALTINLHLLMISFYQPTPKKNKIIIEHGAFPSDQYAVESQIRLHGYDPNDVLIEIRPRAGEICLRTKDIVDIINQHGDSVATVLIGSVNYYTGQAFEIETITKAAHSVGARAGFDLAHGAGNLNLNLHNWGVDFAVWCTYKYLCGGAGSPGGIFVHEKHEGWTGARLNGWWGNKDTTRFIMDSKFDPAVGAEGWQISNAPILAMACLRSSMAIFSDAGMPAIINKSKKLTGYLEYLMDSLEEQVNIITPRDSKQRGAQLSLVVKKNPKDVFNGLNKNQIVCDWREPDVIRVAPVPLYNTFVDVYRFYEVVKDLVI
jgi:kynureninase